jgi:D-psicose/D-tagatose/L-ribulose 3-epimerase
MLKELSQIYLGQLLFVTNAITCLKRNIGRLNMYFGANTFIWQSPFTTRDISLFDHIKGLGFESVEIAVENQDLIDPMVVKHALLRTTLRGLVCGVFGLDRDLNSVDPAIREQAKLYLHWCIDFAQTIGSPVVIGPMYACVGKARLLPPEERKLERSRSVTEIRECCDYAMSKGMKLAVEPLNRFECDMVNTVSQGLEYIQEVDRPNLGFNLDTFHMHLEEKDSAAAICLAGERLFHVHASENDRGVPGTGQVHWHAIAAALKMVHYNQAIVIESFTPAVKSIAQAVCIWREIAPSQDAIASQGLAFLHSLDLGS